MRNFMRNYGPHLKWETFISCGLKITSLIIFLGLMLCFYWLVLDREPAVVVESGRAVAYERQADGSYLTWVHWKGTRYRQCTGTSKRWLVGENGIILPLEEIPYPPEVRTRPLGPYEWEVPIRVPQYYITSGHTSGEYRIRILYACNPLQEIVWPIVEEPDPVPFELPISLHQR